MQPEIAAALEVALRLESLPAETMRAAVDAIMEGRCSEAETAALLTSLATKGETAEELVGAAQSMRRHATRVRPAVTGLLDTCGTGGDHLHTFNISTATALVVAACGVPVAKHGNRCVSSSSGSADVLEALGVNVGLPPEQVARCIDEIGLGFCYARALHGAMKHVAPVRSQLGFRTIFNLLGPMTNPAGADRQLIGANNNRAARLIAEAIKRLGTTRTVVVCGADELDEVALWGETACFDVREGAVHAVLWTAASFGLAECSPRDLEVSSPAESAERIRSVLAGEAGPALDIVLANASAALIVAGSASSPARGVEQARSAVESGRARNVLERLIEWTNAG